MGFLTEFKSFAMKGNVVDLAVGVVMGSVFGKIVSSLVDDILTPVILTPALKAANISDLSQLTIPGTAVKYGSFLSNIISFVIVALALFMIIKWINRMKKKDEAPAEPSATDKLLMEIRDTLKKQ
ncbi:MAG: large conductance mechanosensitive channel protein MscL [Bacteroidota bacterium]|jgi:large conductance mechanosensitive channel